MKEHYCASCGVLLAEDEITFRLDLGVTGSYLCESCFYEYTGSGTTYYGELDE